MFFINIPAFKEIINRHLDLFKKKINPQVTAESLFNDFIDENTDVTEILNYNDGLLGILLGFGKHNAMLFQRREELENLLARKKKSGIFKNEDIQNQLILVNDKLHPFHDHDPYIIASTNRVCFAANPDHHETIQLRNKYDELNIKINEIYSREDWFEQTLLQLFSN